jgi:hypothetical protein
MMEILSLSEIFLILSNSNLGNVCIWLDILLSCTNGASRVLVYRLTSGTSAILRSSVIPRSVPCFE